MVRFTQLHWRDLTVCNEQYFVMKYGSVKIDQGRQLFYARAGLLQNVGVIH
jgi:hypothetical protein